MPDSLAALEAGVAAANWPEVGRSAHALKGVTAQVGGMQLSAQLAYIERTMQNGGTIDAAAVFVSSLVGFGLAWTVGLLRRGWDVLERALNDWTVAPVPRNPA